MAPGGGICKEMIESHVVFGNNNYGMASTNVELRCSPCRKATTGLGTSNNDVHELLDCPVCLNLMYPPIYQVCSHLHIESRKKSKKKKCIRHYNLYRPFLVPLFLKVGLET